MRFNRTAWRLASPLQSRFLERNKVTLVDDILMYTGTSRAAKIDRDEAFRYILNYTNSIGSWKGTIIDLLAFFQGGLGSTFPVEDLNNWQALQLILTVCLRFFRHGSGIVNCNAPLTQINEQCSGKNP